MATTAREQTSALTRETSADSDGCGQHEQPHRDPPPGASATALDPKVIPQITTISVSAHQGATLLRKQGSGWVSAGKHGCVVPEARVARALSNLTQLTVAKQHRVWPPDEEFTLQLDVLTGDEHDIHFEIGARRASTDLVKLLNDDVVELRGLDRALWSANPAAWCVEP